MIVNKSQSSRKTNMPTSKKKKQVKKATKNASKANERTPIKTKKVGKTITFEAKPKSDPFMSRSPLIDEPADSPFKRTNSQALLGPQVPNRAHPSMGCMCGNSKCLTVDAASQQNGIPLFIRQLAEQLGEKMGAQGVVVIGMPLDPANPRPTAPTEAELKEILSKFL
jgi:hypothetical protein